MNTITTEPIGISIEPHKTFATFAEAWRYTCDTIRELQSKGAPVYAARTWMDRFTNCRPRDPQSKLLGFGKQAVRDCERLAPGGRWTVIAQTETNSLSLMGDIHRREMGGYAFTVRYSKFLPYAYAMMMSENGYTAFGLDYESINSHYKTCCGFNDIACDEFTEQADFNLYDELASASHKIKSPTLPFDEVFLPCVCYVHARKPALLKRFVKDQSHWIWQHARAVERSIQKLPQLLAA